MRDEENIRSVPNKRNMQRIKISFLVFIVCVARLVRIVCFKRAGLTRGVYYLLGMGSVSLLVLVFNILNFWKVKSTNELLTRLPYGFDYQKEFSTYQIIGKRKRKAKNGAIRFSKYSEWKEYLDGRYLNHKECDDFYRFPKRLLREKRDKHDLLTIVILPLEIAVSTIYLEQSHVMGGFGGTCLLICVIGFLGVFLSINILMAREEVNFLKDYIDILYPEKGTEGVE